MFNCYLWLNRWIEGDTPVLIVQNSMDLPAVQVYDVRFGVSNGIRLGFMFRTPLHVTLEPEYLIACRHNADVIGTAMELTSSECKYRVGGLLLYTVGDIGVMACKSTVNDENVDYLES
jgi:hypothetical protein